MRRLNSRPRTHGQRRRQTSAPDKGSRPADKNVRRANRQSGSPRAHRDVRYAPADAYSGAFRAGNDWQSARSRVGLPEWRIFKVTRSSTARLPSGFEVIREIRVGKKV